MALDAASLARRLAALPAEKRRRVMEQSVARQFDVSSLPIVPARGERALPLSYSQRALWLTWQMAPDSPAYNLAGVLQLTGALRREALDAALASLVERHEILRTRFVSGNALDPVMVIGSVSADLLTFHDLSREPAETREERAWQIAQDFAEAPFHLEAAPACRFTLIRLGERAHWLVIVAHHIVADEASQSILIEELAELYQARVSGRGVPAGGAAHSVR